MIKGTNVYVYVCVCVRTCMHMCVHSLTCFSITHCSYLRGLKNFTFTMLRAEKYLTTMMMTIFYLILKL